MKNFLTIIFAAFILSACSKKSDEPKPVIPDTTNDPSIAIKKAVGSLDKNKIKTHRGALEALMNLPGGGPIPPHLLPAKDLKLEKETDSTALYSFTTAYGGVKANVRMRRRITGAETA